MAWLVSVEGFVESKISLHEEGVVGNRRGRREEGGDATENVSWWASLLWLLT